MTHHYRERLSANIWMYVVCAFVIPASLLVFLPVGLELGIAVAAVMYAALVMLLISWSPVISVSDDGLRAGRAFLPAEFVGEAHAFEDDEAVLQRGQKLDARAWLMIRGWISPVVKVENTDANDPAPYWLLSTRNPQELKQALATISASKK